MSTPTKSAYPCEAWRIYATEHNPSSRVNMVRIVVTGRRGETAMCEERLGGMKPCARPFECPVSQLASTRHKALKKLNTLLTALESRPPLVSSGMGPHAPSGMTDSGAGNPKPKTETATT